MNISVVIITKNEGAVLEKMLQSVAVLSDDIVIVDSGSVDETIAIAMKYNARIIKSEWKGYGANKNIGNKMAKYDWILSLDADEKIDETLGGSLLELAKENKNVVFNISFKNYFCGKLIRFGEWGFESHIRLFNRKATQWDNAVVHESLELKGDFIIKNIKGYVHHNSFDKLNEYHHKVETYARLKAKKFFFEGKQTGFYCRFIYPVLSFLHNYIVRLGFLDGKQGLQIAKGNFRYVFLKYKYLSELNKSTVIKQPQPEPVVIGRVIKRRVVNERARSSMPKA